MGHTTLAALREAGAVGTEESLLATYGVHINAEIPALDASTLLAYLKAFGVLQWWTVDAHEVDVTRKVSPYIDLYPVRLSEAGIVRGRVDHGWDLRRLPRAQHEP